MKSRYNFWTPLLMTVLVFSCLWTVTDVAYGVRMWEQDAAAWGSRIKALAVILVDIVISYFFFNYLATVFLKRNQRGKLCPEILEYLLAVLFTIVTFNISLHIVIAYINGANYRWGEALMINATGIPIFLFYYTLIRNNILTASYTEKILQLEKLKVDQLETELKLLRSQYHPHFLFNALNTVYFQIDEENEAATESIDLLSALLRYQLYDINTKVTLQQEINYLRTYIQFQQLRMTERLQFEYSFDPGLSDQKIHPLLFQPLLENAFKYVGGDYRIEVRMQQEDSKVRFRVFNTIHPDPMDKMESSGIGIDNLKKRLNLLYPDRYTLQILPDVNSFTVDLLIDLSK